MKINSPENINFLHSSLLHIWNNIGMNKRAVLTVWLLHILHYLSYVIGLRISQESMCVENKLIRTQTDPIVPSTIRM